MIRSLLFILAILVFYSCSPEAEKKDVITAPVTETVDKENQEIIEELFHSIPPPVELSSLLKESGYTYNLSYLNSLENAENYTITEQKALNLGVYGTDIGYIHIYEQQQDALNYLNTIKTLAEDLDIINLLDYQTLKDLLKEEQHYDSLLDLTTHNFENINIELRNQGREHISAMIVSGGWLEGFHILHELYKASNSPELNEKIAEQKFTLAQILLLLSHFEDRPAIVKLAEDFKKIQLVLENAELTKLSEDQDHEGWYLAPEFCEELVGLTDAVRGSIIK